MKYVILFICLLLHLADSTAQVKSLESFFKKLGVESKTYAIIVGISDYKDPEIPDLRFAHKDAEIFSNYLKSKAGGAVPDEQIKLLLGPAATVANVYNALSWIEKKVNKGDKFYFYFAGHGDLESSLYKLGFLLTYDTPYQNYINNAIRIEDINNLANTLSVNKEVNTILITDACHSGKLAGSDNKGNSLVGEQLSLVQKKEIRIASCEANQKSQENVIWGGGRGVFSYYLVNGMKGYADDDKDENVTLQELKTYLEKNVSRDVMKLKLEEQNPVIDGRQFTVISKVIEQPKDSIPDLVASTSGEQITSRDINDHSTQNADRITNFFNYYSDIKLEDDFDFSKIISKPINAIPDLVFNELNSKKSNPDTNMLNALKDPEERTKFNSGFAAMIHNQAQEAINLYLNADIKELEKREYYNSALSNYDKYSIMIQAALELLDKEDYLHHILQVKLHYFNGIAARLKIPVSGNPDSLMNIAFKEQILALALEDKAAYIYNEIGLLYAFKSEKDFAEKYYQKAIELSPAWAIPKSNISALYATQKKYDQGIKSALAALALSPNYSKARLNLGINYEGAGNWLFAEEQYRNYLEANSKHYLSFEKLGFLYLRHMNYALADSFFRSADLRLVGFESMITNPSDGTEALNDMAQNRPYILDKIPPVNTESSEKYKDSIMVPFVEAMSYFNAKNYSVAKSRFIQLGKVDPTNPLLYRYLAEIYYREQNWLAAEINFKYADQFYLDSQSFLEYCEKTKRTQKRIPESVELVFRSKHYDKSELMFFFGKMYESWGRYDDAKSYYEKIIQQSNSDVTGYYLLWNMYERMGRYDDCEHVIRNYRIQNKLQGEAELLAFYKRRQMDSNAELQYTYKGANLLYSISAELPAGNELNPNSDKVVAAYYESQSWRNYEPVVDKIIPAIKERMNLAGLVSNARISGLSMFESVCKLSYDTIILADAHAKMGDLYLWAGDRQNAVNQYKLSLDFAPGYANKRMSIIQFCNDNFIFSQALQHLNSLAQSKQIDYENMLLLADYLIRQSKFTEADSLLNLLLGINPNRKTEIDELKAKSNLFSGNLKSALTYYLKKADQIRKDFNTKYLVSRIYALQKDNKKAKLWLKKSLQDGFKYYRVIQMDSAWNAIRKQKDWKNIVPEYEIMEN